ncbi:MULTISPECIES: hypothetical protein [Brevibacterium]|uniref:hypothetical protein n=1 Tax=Brevibacterium TaxID=1696 RepID=UPI0025BD36CA|nr:hypothetical protein [Brevibacterium sp.]
MASARRHERHGRSPVVFRGRVPAARTRAEAFAHHAALLFSRIRERAGGPLDAVELLVDDVPAPEAGLELACVLPARRGSPAAVVVHRLPVIARCETDEELGELLSGVLADQASLLTGLDPDELRD